WIASGATAAPTAEEKCQAPRKRRDSMKRSAKLPAAETEAHLPAHTKLEDAMLPKPTPRPAARWTTIAALVVVVFAVGPATMARATTIVVNDAASCATIGGSIVVGACRLYIEHTIEASDTLQLGIDLQMVRLLTVNGTVNVGSNELETAFDAVNNGTINVGPGGDINNIDTQATFTNNGTVNLACGATVIGTISGNPPAGGACVPPDKSTDTCEGNIVRAVGVLTVSITKCRAKGADSAFKPPRVPFDEDACEALAKTKFDTKVAKLAASCPACALANASTFR